VDFTFTLLLPVPFFGSNFVDLVAADFAALGFAAAGLAVVFELEVALATGFSFLDLTGVLATAFAAVLLPLFLAATLLVDFTADLAAGFDAVAGFAVAFLAGAVALFEGALATGFAELFAAAVFEEEMTLVSLGLEDFASDFEGVEPAKRLESKPLRFLPAFASVEPFANLFTSHRPH
jgi:hypothetical protein